MKTTTNHITYDESKKNAERVKKEGRTLTPDEVATVLIYAEAAQDALLNLKSVLLLWGRSPIERGIETIGVAVTSPQSSSHKFARYC
jgi:hypothetical protein